MKLTLLFLTTVLLQVSASSYSQKITYSGENVPLETVLEAIEKSSGYTFFYNVDLLKRTKPVTISKKEVSLEAFLRECLKDQPLDYVIRNKTISLRAKSPGHNDAVVMNLPADSTIVVTGQITDEDGKPMTGVSVMVKGGAKGTSSNQNGYYTLSLTPQDKVLVFSFVGMKLQEVPVNKRTSINVVMVAAADAIENVVVTGFYNKSKTTFTGSAVTFTGEELKSIAPTNLIQALSTVTTGLVMVENNNLGSNPNNIPEILVRGVTSFATEATGQSVNQPLIVRDGTIITLRDLYDMDINEIASVTVLKDASAAAVYGARAANGVIVIERKKIESGRLSLAYNATGSIQLPDFSDYRILNAEEKLEYERLAGLYTNSDPERQYELDELYNQRFKDIQSGVFTDWMKKPARTGYTMDHSLRMSGGSGNTRYELNTRFGSTGGVMKDDYRRRYGLGFVLEYYPLNGLTLTNRTTLNWVNTQASPYGSFLKYTQANPYDRVYDEFGNFTMDLSWDTPNPLYEAQLGSYSRSQESTFSNDFDARWQINNNFRLTTHFNLSSGSGTSKSYLSPLSRAYRDVLDNTQKGSLAISNNKSFLYSGNLVLSYNKFFTGNSLLTTNVGANINRDNYENYSFTGIGFYSDELRSINFSSGYPQTGSPSGSQDLSTYLGGFVNVNYAHKDRYYFDGVYQVSGSSKFGANNRYGHFWSTGVGWNIHNEDFAQTPGIEILKIRGSVGYTGKVNFASYQSLTTYRYQNDLEYFNGVGAVPIAIGNPDLKWERTMNYNIGIDVSLWERRFNLTADVYKKKTTDLLIDKTIAPSAGTMTGKDNLGEMENKGIEVNIDGEPIRRKSTVWRLGLMVSHNSNKILKISEALKKQNDDYNSVTTGRPLPQFAEGESIMAIKVVQSGGIDPATGQEVYIKRNGERTFVYDPDDKVVVGDGMPLFTGTFFSALSYKRFTIAPYFSFTYGGYIYNETRIRKVEGANPIYNADKRVFDSRWKNPGDIAAYKDIADQTSPRQTTRFVEKENMLTLRRLNINYQVEGAFMKKLGISKMALGVSANDIFRISTVEMERGTDYLFSRGFDMTLNVIF